MVLCMMANILQLSDILLYITVKYEKQFRYLGNIAQANMRKLIPYVH